MTFDREPDLDNANVGTPINNDIDIMRKLFEKSGSFRFFYAKRRNNGI